MSGTSTIRRIATWVFLALLAVAGPAAARSPEATGPPSARQEEEPEGEATRRPSSMEDDAELRRFRIGGFGGRLSGATAAGLAENLFFRATFEQGTDTLWGGRAAYAFLPRFDVEAELGQASPGLTAVLTDLGGQGRTDVPFADMDLRYTSLSVVYHIVDRHRPIVPFLQLGPAIVSVDSEQEPRIDATEFALLYGAGIRVRPAGRISVRADVRGLRSRFGSDQSSAGDVSGLFDDQFGATVPGILDGEFNATNLVWTVGLDVHF